MEEAEQRASKIGGALLFALAAYVMIGAGWSLWTQRAQEFFNAGAIDSLVAIPTMYFLAKRKISIAEQIGSRALRADAVKSITCGWLSVMVVVGLTAQYLTGAWSVEFRHLARIVWFLVKEAEAGQARNALTLAIEILDVRFGS